MRKSTPRLLPFPLSNPTNTDDLICVSFKIPNRLEYRSIIRGQLQDLGIWGVWERDDNQTATKVAEMFRRLMFETLSFDSECDGMNCNEVIDCFEDELDNQDFVDKINQALITNTGNDNSPYYPFVKGNRLPSGVINSAVIPATCTNDIMYGAAISTINNLADIVLDWVERFETADDGFQIVGQIVDTIPAVGAVADELIVQDIIEFAGLIIEQFIDQYRAGDTLELRTELACILFCNTKDNCAITMQDIYDAITEYNFIDVLDQWQVVELISSITTGTLPDDKLFVGFLQLAVMSFFASNFFSGQLGGEAFLKGIILEGFDEPSSDWELLCLECEEIDYTITFDTGGWNYTNLIGTIVAGVGNPNNAAAIAGFAQVSVNVTWDNPTSFISMDVKVNDANFAVFVLDASENIIGSIGLSGFGNWQSYNIPLTGSHTTMRISIQDGGDGQDMLVDNIRPFAI